jgi:hypothetical protein
MGLPGFLILPGSNPAYLRPPGRAPQTSWALIWLLITALSPPARGHGPQMVPFQGAVAPLTCQDITLLPASNAQAYITPSPEPCPHPSQFSCVTHHSPLSFFFPLLFFISACLFHNYHVITPQLLQICKRRGWSYSILISSFVS